MTQVTCRLTAKNRDQLRNPTLGNRAWATFLYKYCHLLTYLLAKLRYFTRCRLGTVSDVRTCSFVSRTCEDRIRQSASRLVTSHRRSQSFVVNVSCVQWLGVTHAQDPRRPPLSAPESASVYCTCRSLIDGRDWLTDVWWCATSQEAGYTQGEVTSQSLWSWYGRHFVCITRHNALSYISCYSNKIESFNLRKCPYDHWLTNKAYLSATTVTNISKSFTYKMATKTSWHR